MSQTRGKHKKQLGEILVETGRLTAADLERALEAGRRERKRLGEAIVDLGICSETEIIHALSSQIGIPSVDLEVMPVEPSAIELVPEKLAKRFQLVPIALEGRQLMVAMTDPLDLEAIQDVQFATGLELRPCIATRKDVEWAIGKHYQLSDSVDEIVKDICTDTAVEVLPDAPEEGDLQDLRSQSEAAPIIRMVNHIISNAVTKRASDIHVEPARSQVIVRYRIDGELRRDMDLPKWVQGAVTSRIKLMAQMDIAEKRVPQDGRIGVTVSQKKLDLRTSTLPTAYGEKIVIRILDSSNALMSLDRIGMNEEMQKRFASIVSKPQGIVLVTGPTGSGKTTTLYAALAHINTVARNITTIEDPIEYELKGINQVGINEKAGRTFPSVLASLLRQDPDVVMVGEMRDAETATIAMQASLTGHFVLSTIHTNNTIATITRLRDLGIPSYMIASTINAVLAQRLVRGICEQCKTEYEPDEADLELLGLLRKKEEGTSFCHGAGCAACGQTGFTGRVGLFEILVLSPRIKEYVSRDASESTLRQLALAEGMHLLVHNGRDHILAGKTTASEVLRVVQTDEGSGTTCGQCGEIVSPEFLACPHCGIRLINSCPSCSMMLDKQWKFCPYCAHGAGDSDSDARAA